MVTKIIGYFLLAVGILGVALQLSDLLANGFYAPRIGYLVFSIALCLLGYWLIKRHKRG